MKLPVRLRLSFWRRDPFLNQVAPFRKRWKPLRRLVCLVRGHSSQIVSHRADLGRTELWVRCCRCGAGRRFQ